MVKLELEIMKIQQSLELTINSKMFSYVAVTRIEKKKKLQWFSTKIVYFCLLHVLSVLKYPGAYSI